MPSCKKLQDETAVDPGTDLEKHIFCHGLLKAQHCCGIFGHNLEKKIVVLVDCHNTDWTRNLQYIGGPKRRQS